MTAYSFGDHRLDLQRRELRRGGDLVETEPQVFDLLAYLVQHRDRVIAKDDLLEAVWGGRIVSDSALTTRVNAVRRALGDDGQRQQVIRTLSRKGLRFIAEVTETPDRASSSAAPAAAPPAPEKPAIAVLPFATIDGVPEQVALADGTVEEIVTALSRIPWLSVIARSAGLACRGEVADVKRVGRELGVRYVLEGSVRTSGGTVRVAVQLIEADSRAYVWAERFEGSLGHAFELQDRVAASVAGMLEPMIEALEMRRSAAAPASALGAYDLYRIALPGCYSYAARPLLQAHDLLEQAVERDPGFAPAVAAAAGCRQFLAATGWAGDPQENRQQAIELAHQALQADGDAPAVLAEAARVLAYFTEDIDCAIAMIERAVVLNPSFARGWFWNGWIAMLAGQPDLALGHLQIAARLNPRHRAYGSSIGMAHFLAGRYRDAATALVGSLHERPGWPTTLRFLAASYAHLGEIDKARVVADRLRSVTPSTVPPDDGLGKSPFRNREQSALYAEGLRLAVGAT